VSGGYVNTSSGDYSFVGSGCFNTASGYASTLAGGTNGLIDSCFIQASILGGLANYISDTTPPTFSYLSCCGWNTIGGGSENQATTQWSTIAGGFRNRAFGQGTFIGGGVCNHTCGCDCSMIVGSNICADRVCATFVNNLSIKNIPTSSAGLPSGSVWNDLGTLKIV
jgi:hypothetical protein